MKLVRNDLHAIGDELEEAWKEVKEEKEKVARWNRTEKFEATRCKEERLIRSGTEEELMYCREDAIKAEKEKQRSLIS